jgi:ABC-type uncharacterized transport system permease subunit
MVKSSFHNLKSQVYIQEIAVVVCVVLKFVYLKIKVLPQLFTDLASNVGPSVVRALPLAAGINVGGHYKWHLVRAECVRCPWLLA